MRAFDAKNTPGLSIRTGTEITIDSFKHEMQQEGTCSDSTTIPFHDDLERQALGVKACRPRGQDVTVVPSAFDLLYQALDDSSSKNIVPYKSIVVLKKAWRNSFWTVSTVKPESLAIRAKE